LKGGIVVEAEVQFDIVGVYLSTAEVFVEGGEGGAGWP
jgi:hypothetical protein